MKYLLYLILVFVIVSSCKKDYLKARYELTHEEKEYLPYQTGEILKYLNTYDSSEMLLEATEPVSKIYSQLDGVNTQYYYEYQTIRQTLVGSSMIISMEISSIPKIYNGKSTYVFYYYWVPDTIPDYYGGARIPMDTINFNSHLTYYDSIKIIDNTYFDVYEGEIHISSEDKMNQSEKSPIKYFYALTYGIIRIDYSDSTSLLLLSRE